MLRASGSSTKGVRKLSIPRRLECRQAGIRPSTNQSHVQLASGPSYQDIQDRKQESWLASVRAPQAQNQATGLKGCIKGRLGLSFVPSLQHPLQVTAPYVEAGQMQKG